LFQGHHETVQSLEIFAGGAFNDTMIPCASGGQLYLGGFEALCLARCPRVGSSVGS